LIFWQVFSQIASLRPPKLVHYARLSPSQLLARSGLTERWRRHKLSNFDYLMQLNTIAGKLQFLFFKRFFKALLCDQGARTTT
jgi:hypothetical protein